MLHAGERVLLVFLFCQKVVSKSFREGKKMTNSLIVCSEAFYDSIVSLTDSKSPVEVMSYEQSLLSRIQRSNSNKMDFANLVKKFIHYENIYIIPRSVNEGFDLTLFFSEIGSKVIVAVTNDGRYIPIYKTLGAKIVVTANQGNATYSWLHHIT